MSRTSWNFGTSQLPIYRSSYSNCLIHRSSEHTWNIAVRYSCLQPKLTWKKLDTIQRIAARIMFKVPSDTHAEPIIILLQLGHLGDRREQHIVELMKSFVCGSCHPAMTLLFHQQPHGALSIPHSWTEQLLVNDVPPWSVRIHLTDGLWHRGIQIHIWPRYKELKWTSHRDHCKITKSAIYPANRVRCCCCWFLLSVQ